jgi:hypothetical protein
MCGDVLNVLKKSKKGSSVNILGSNEGPHAFMWQCNVGHDDRKRSKIQVAEVKNCQERYQIKLNKER